MVYHQKGSKVARKKISRLPLLASIFYGCSYGILGWGVIQGFLVPASLAQEEIDLLEVEESPVETFRDEDIPPGPINLLYLM
ncbi:hypothetical protein [Cyanothece sp. BG0011]|uniref:hypothetical protein n=1 Tax=Cyanothece sp. BG0011 TaxID=2082950 RepID=UPI0018E58A59|nr:hypothetical protein [Cyanothece sp. BG0011]